MTVTIASPAGRPEAARATPVRDAVAAIERHIRPGRRALLSGVSWETYVAVSEAHSDLITAYDDGLFEILMPDIDHEFIKEAISLLVRVLCRVYGHNYVAGGNTTYRREAKRKGLEPDACFYLHARARDPRVRRANTAAVAGSPDLAVEVDLSSGSSIKEPIYATLAVAELWRWKDGRVTVRVLRDGAYVDSPRSGLLPEFDSAWVPEAVRMRDEMTDDELERAWEARLRSHRG